MKKTVFSLTFVVAICVCAVMAISAREKENRFTFQTVIFPGDTFTQLLGINDFEGIAGYHGANVNKGFVFTFPNTFTPENFPNSAQTQVIGINNRGFTDGFYIDNAGITHGFLDINGTFTAVDFPPFTLNQLLGLNNFDQAAGYYAVPPTPAGIDTPYIFDDNGGVFLRIRIAQATAAPKPPASTIISRSRVFSSTALGSTMVFCSRKGGSSLSIFLGPPRPRHSA
jgi:hypothetical protein